MVAHKGSHQNSGEIGLLIVNAIVLRLLQIEIVFCDRIFLLMDSITSKNHIEG